MDRIFYLSGPGNIIDSHGHWKARRQNPTEVSLTFSGQVQDACKAIGARGYFVASYGKHELLIDDDFTMEHRPKGVYGGARFHLNELRYAIGLVHTARKFGAQVAVVDSGCVHSFLLILFRLVGIKVVPVLHNALWPSGFPPQKLISRLVLGLDALFWRWGPSAVLAVSPECQRQLEQIAPQHRYPIYQMRAQFYPNYFARIPPPPAHSQRPFRVMYVGRIVRNKGVFDILTMARAIEDSHPGLVRWELCGKGIDFDDLKALHQRLQLHSVVNLRGWTSPEDQISIYATSHASIVPTTSGFAEGLSMAAAEAVLSGRPVVTNPIVPALEVLRSACVAAKPDDPSSYAEAVVKLATDSALYERCRQSCAQYQAQFYDRSLGFAAVLQRALVGDVAAEVVPEAAADVGLDIESPEAPEATEAT